MRGKRRPKRSQGENVSDAKTSQKKKKAELRKVVERGEKGNMELLLISGAERRPARQETSYGTPQISVLR